MKINVKDWEIIWYFFRSYKIQSVSVLIFTILSGFLEMLNLAALYPVINYGLSLEKKNFVLTSFEKVTEQIAPDKPFLAACILLIIISILAVLSKFIYNYLSNKLLTKIMSDTQKKIFEIFTIADFGYYVRNQQGELIYAGTIAPEKTTVTILHSINLAYYSINGLFLFSLLVILSWQATCIILGVGVIYATVIKKVMQEYIQKCAMICVEEKQRKNVILNEFITGIKAIKIFLADDYWKKRYFSAVDRELSNQFRMMMGRIFPEMFVRFLFYMLIALTGVYFAQKPQQEMIALLPMLGTFGIVVNRFLPSIHAIGSSIMKIAECVPDTKIIYQLCRLEFVDGQEGSQELAGFNDKIVFEHVYFKYNNAGDFILKDVSFSIVKRNITALVGFSGSGKTTIISLLLKLYQPEKGAIKIDGVNVALFDHRSYLGRIGYVSQETFIFNSTIRENIQFGMENCSDEMIEEAAKLANADEFIKETSDGYETMVGDSGVKLSGGQRQRLAIARAMLRKPEIIVLDEATSSLDNVSERKIQTAINNISKHTTVLVIAHRLSTVQNADKIIILEKGEVKEQGTHEELLRNKKLYYDLHVSKDAQQENTNELVEG